MPRNRKGFTLLEIVVALTAGVALLVTARAMITTVADTGDELAAIAAIADADANGERLLRSLVARIDVDTAQSSYFGGDGRRVEFTSWCEVPAGWLERCRVRIGFDSAAAGNQLTVTLAGREAISVRRGFSSGVIRYLRSADDGGSWFQGWGMSIALPLAIGVITDRDTMIVRLGGR